MARHGLRIIVQRCAADAEITLDVVVGANSYATLKDLVRHGDGWTTLPLAPIHQEVIPRGSTAAPLVNPVRPSSGLVVRDGSADHPPRSFRAKKAIIDTVTDRVERVV